MNQGKLEVVKQEISRVNIDTLGISSVQLFSHIRLFVTPWTAARQASLSITNSQSLLKLMSAEDQPRLIQGIRRGDGVGDLFKW